MKSVRRWSIPIVAGLAALLFIRLGIWQLDRLSQRRTLNALVRAQLDLPPMVIPPVPLESDSLDYRRGTVHGVYDLDRQVVEMARSHQGGPAVHVVTPLVFGDSVAVLVERGWVPSPDSRSVNLNAIAEPESTTVEGVMLPAMHATQPPSTDWPTYVRSADPATLQRLYPYRLLPAVLRRTEPSPDTPGALRAIPMPRLDNGPHLSYAIQWFAFATIAIIGGVILFRRVGAAER